MNKNAIFLHLAASRFERLEDHILQTICTPEWVHLGEPPINWSNEIIEQIYFGRPATALRLALASLYRQYRPKTTIAKLKTYYAATDFREFFFKAGDPLPFENGMIEFGFAEHFFEHLWFDEAISLLKEIYRILKHPGVFRISVPDADLRVYLPPESPGFPGRRVPWNHHQKHKMRWNVNSLCSALEISGFQAKPRLYCDQHGVFHDLICQAGNDSDNPATAKTFIGSTQYLRRLPSLIVDAYK
jgi:predicted SAM-dependent methyltransferase